MNTGIVFNIQKFCIHDGDGIRTCVFLKGCPLNCIWCHNPESLDKKLSLSFTKSKCTSCGRCLGFCAARKIQNGSLEIEFEKCIKCSKCVDACFNGANEIIGREMTASFVIQEVMKDKIFYDNSGGGLTVTGGEPSFQPEFTTELLRLAKNEGISVAVETCGIGSREFYKNAADIGTTFLFDIKCIDAVRHRELTSVDNAHIIANLKYLMDRQADIIIRLPLVPDCNDSDEDIIALAGFLNENKGKYRYSEIMPYHSAGTIKYEKIGKTASYICPSATDLQIDRWCALFNLYGVDVKVSK